ncbi:hypothetical protein CBS101457_001946 [Exobasidium rhododendri]|nr:hypothetical protein CBS101457_001946 [Exobasidium rhododendri]
MTSDSASDILIHPDAIHCLKRKQLENLCIRLDMKSTGKKEELIARLEGYSIAKISQADKSKRQSFASLQPQSKEEDVAGEERYASGSRKEYREDGDGNTGTGSGALANAGPSIRLITKSKDESVEEGVGRISRSSSRRSILGERNMNDEELSSMPVTSSSAKTLYPWKRLSGSLPRAMRSSSSNPTLASVTASATGGDHMMALDDFGVTKVRSETSRKGSLSSIKRWLSSSSVSSSKESPVEAVSELPPQIDVPVGNYSPISKRKRGEDDGTDVVPGLFSTFNSPSPERPVKRMIKGRPSRAVKTTVNIQVACATPASHTALALVDPANEAASKVWEEMNARLKQSGKAPMIQLPSENDWSTSSSLKPPASPLKSLDSRTKGRFSNEHKKEFGKMDSIANHYAVRKGQDSTRSVSVNRESAPKRAKAAERVPAVQGSERSAEEKAAIQRKLELSRQRRKSVGRQLSTPRKNGATSGRIGFKSKFSGAVRDIVGAAKNLTTVGDVVRPVAVPPATSYREMKLSQVPDATTTTAPSTSTAISTTSKAAKSTSLSLAKSRTTFDLRASLARKPTGYTPYSAKETVQMIQKGAILNSVPHKQAGVEASPAATTTATATTPPSPIRSGWTLIPPPSKSNRLLAEQSTSSSIAFPCVSPCKETAPQIAITSARSHPLPALPLSLSSRPQSEVAGSPSRTPQLRQAPAKKTRSSISATQRAVRPTQGDRLKRAAKANEIKHQTSMAARRRQVEVVQRVVAKAGKADLAKTTVLPGVGRGSPRKVSTKIAMKGEGRGAPGSSS